MNEEIRISVRRLVEYVYRSGDIDSRFRSAKSMIEGTKIHQQIQSHYKEEDEREVPLILKTDYKGIHFSIEGRCDGLLKTEDNVMVDEIKSTRRHIDELTADQYPVHWGQAKIYAYIYAKEHHLESIHVQLTYVQAESGEAKRFQQTFAYKELTIFLNEMLEGYRRFAQYQIEHEKHKTESSDSLAFPFANYREGQRRLAGSVYKTIEEGANLFASAPTGIGKTISTVFPAVKAMGKGIANKLFYVTAKTITREAAEEAFSLMQSQGLVLNVVTLTAKDKICFQEETICQPDYCPFAEGYYDRLNEGILDMLSNETLMDRAVIVRYARKHRLCPFEFSLDAAYAADAVICDYNYLFDPRVSLKRFFEEEKKRTIVLVDEAHNLVDRGRTMFSSELLKSAFLTIKREYKQHEPDLSAKAKAINDHLLELKKSCGGAGFSVVKELDSELIEKLDLFIEAAEKVLLDQVPGSDSDSLLREAYFASQHAIRIAKLYDNHYVTYLEMYKSEVRWRLYCLDPSSLLQQTGKRYRSVVYFSATLQPFSYYQEMLGMTEEDYTLQLPSPFDRDRTEIQIVPLSTKYRDREKTKLPIAEAIYRVIKKRPGQYLFFFPSYAYMQMVYDCFIELDDRVPVLVQDRAMTESGREDFLKAFKKDSEEQLAGFAVLGGIFSEGIDLRGNRLNGVVIVGVGLPQIGGERDVIKSYYDRQGKSGFDYAYVFPGMNKVLQAGGRLIRSETDEGIIMLIDDRYLTRKYQRLIPYEWQHYQVIT